MTSWVPYSKIPYKIPSDVSNKKREKWIVTEKIHGANFSVFHDGFEVYFAKRTRILSPDEAFYQYQRIASRCSDCIKSLFERLQDSNIVSITVYGELFGGCYPHSMVKSVSGLNAVQSGIWYTPDLMFAVFDVAIYRKDGTRQFMPFLKMLDECKLAGFFVLEPLFVGSQSQAFSISTEFQSKIPDRLGLPSLDSNLCEGVVLRPESEPPSTCLRVKIKNKQFSELVEADYDPQTDKMDIGRILYRFNRFRIDGAKSKLGDGASDIEVADNAVEDLISDISAESYQMTVLVASLTPEDFQAIRDFVISTFLQDSS